MGMADQKLTRLHIRLRRAIHEDHLRVQQAKVDFSHGTGEDGETIMAATVTPTSPLLQPKAYVAKLRDVKMSPLASTAPQFSHETMVSLHLLLHSVRALRDSLSLSEDFQLMLEAVRTSAAQHLSRLGTTETKETDYERNLWDETAGPNTTPGQADSTGSTNATAKTNKKQANSLVPFARLYERIQHWPYKAKEAYNVRGSEPLTRWVRTEFTPAGPVTVLVGEPPWTTTKVAHTPPASDRPTTTNSSGNDSMLPSILARTASHAQEELQERDAAGPQTAALDLGKGPAPTKPTLTQVTDKLMDSAKQKQRTDPVVLKLHRVPTRAEAVYEKWLTSRDLEKSSRPQPNTDNKRPSAAVRPEVTGPRKKARPDVIPVDEVRG